MNVRKYKAVRKSLLHRYGEFAFSIVSQTTGTKLTFLVMRATRGMRWIWLKIGKEAAVYLGTAYNDGKYGMTRKSSLPLNAKPNEVFSNIWSRIRNNIMLPDNLDIYLSCKRCGRELNDIKSITNGIGPFCAWKIRNKEKWFTKGA